MSEKAVQVVDGAIIESKNIEVLPFGLKFRAELNKEEWADAFLGLQHVNTVYQWYLGDLVVQADWQWKGEMYDMMMEATGLDRETLIKLATVARAFPVEAREYVYENLNSRLENGNVSVFKLGYSHFIQLAPMAKTNLEKAVDFLVRAGKEGWTVATLREEISRWKNGGSLPEPRERVEVEIPDGWESVKRGKFNSYVPAPVDLDDENEVRKPFLMQVYPHEAEQLLDTLDGNPLFTSLLERLELGLENS